MSSLDLNGAENNKTESERDSNNEMKTNGKPRNTIFEEVNSTSDKKIKTTGLVDKDNNDAEEACESSSLLDKTEPDQSIQCEDRDKKENELEETSALMESHNDD